VITHLPADIELSFAYRRLSNLLGQSNAAFVFNRLWLDLAFQTRVHGKAGLYQKAYLHHFSKSTALAGDAIAAAIDSGLVVQNNNGDLFCPIFFEYNAHLDMSYIPPTARWLSHWEKWEAGLAESLKGAAKKVPQAFWYLPGGEVITESCMNRALVLIHALDFILHRKPRSPKELDMGTVQGACAIVTKHSDVKISVFLKRFMSLSRPRLNPLYPATTEDALLKFEDLLVLTSPDEGFEAWIKRVTTQNEEENQPEAVGRELAEQLSRIST